MVRELGKGGFDAGAEIFYVKRDDKEAVRGLVTSAPPLLASPLT